MSGRIIQQKLNLKCKEKFQFFQKLLMDLKHKGIHLNINIVYGTLPKILEKNIKKMIH